MLPTAGRGLEIGVGTGRFAEQLGIKIGVEPSRRMRRIAQSRGIRVLDGVAEELPFDDSEFDFVLMVTVVCFVDDINRALMEAYRVLCYGGSIIIGFVNRDSILGRNYLNQRNGSVFYKEAAFYSVEEMVEVIKQAGFIDLIFRQTIFKALPEITADEPVSPGHDKGSFVVIRGSKEEPKDRPRTTIKSK